MNRTGSGNLHAAEVFERLDEGVVASFAKLRLLEGQVDAEDLACQEDGDAEGVDICLNCDCHAYGSGVCWDLTVAKTGRLVVTAQF